MSVCCTLKWIGVVIALYWIFIAAIGLLKIRKIFKKYHNPKMLQNPPQQYQCFMRTDYTKWERSKIILGVIILLPWNLIWIFGFVFTAYFMIFPAQILNAISGSWKLGYKLYRLVIRYFGFMLIRMSSISITHSNSLPVLDTPIIIANHVCWFDTLYLGCILQPISFVSKDAVAKVPLVGRLVKYHKGIFVERQNEANRNKTIQMINGRVQAFNNKQSYYDVFPLLIFPEGTTSNGKSLLKFKTGAFSNKTPITIVCMNYQCRNFDMGMDQITTEEHLILSLAQRSKLSVHFEKIQCQSQQTVEQYMERCRTRMRQILGYKCYNGGYKDAKLYMDELKQLRSPDKND